MGVGAGVGVGVGLGAGVGFGVGFGVGAGVGFGVGVGAAVAGAWEGSTEGSTEGSADGSGVGVGRAVDWAGSLSSTGSEGITVVSAPRSLHAHSRDSAMAALRVNARIRFMFFPHSYQFPRSRPVEGREH